LLFGLGAATGQAVGLILAKKGLGGNFPALSANMMRMLAAAATLWAITLFQGQAGPTFRRLLDNRPAIPSIIGGAVFGPFLGVWLSLVAIRQHIGIASTLMALPPFSASVGHFVSRTVWLTGYLGHHRGDDGVAILFL
jgi:hypothetical protein